MRSPVNWALLGLVIQRPSYGYELVQRFERTYGDALELSSRSHIYVALDSLAARGLIERDVQEPIDEQGRQPKLHYRVTEAGICSYERWLIDHLDEDRRRARVFAQQFAAIGPERALRVLSRLSEACLREVGRPTAEQSEAGASRREALGDRLAGEEERLRAGATLSWIEFAQRELRDALRRRGR
ncbi:MAG: PadR family transcriptional regulator [Solirubrobacteraceae bacterium]